MAKILYTANTDKHIKLCHLPYLKSLKKKGHVIHVATNTNIATYYCDQKIAIPIKRTPFHLSNIKAIFDLKKILSKENYDLIITNTPMGSVITRLAGLKTRRVNKTKIIYIAHGFHFFKGCPKINYFLYYPVEKILSFFTDLIITINEEDYNIAKQKFKCRIKLIHGIGFDEEKFQKTLTVKEKKAFKEKLGIQKEDFVISYIAEISKRKRQKYLIKTLKDIDLRNIKILLVGEDILKSKLSKLLKKYHLEDNIKMLGFRSDINEILEITDLVISLSSQEGLPLNVLEAMYKNKNILVTDCRGNRDLISNKNGRLIGLKDKDALINSIMDFKTHNYHFMNRENSLKYSLTNIKQQYLDIFLQELENKNDLN